MTRTIKEYWDNAASSSRVNWHIAHIDDEEEFFSSGPRDLAKIFPEGLDFLPQGARVLEIGCGKGRIIAALLAARPDIRAFGVDVSSKMAELAYAHARPDSNAVFLVSDGRSLNLFPDNLFDAIYSFTVFQHIPRHYAESTVRDCGRVLRKDGRLIYQVQERPRPQEIDPPFDNYRSIRYYTANQAVQLVVDPLKVLRSRGGGHDFFVEAVKS
jgi:ubiquinone/menaquinone biosynthesis C-methylase UbiE